MLETLQIKNFRLFKELKINRLSSVNLIVGNNNSGKSCLLEALYIYASDGDINNLVELLINRDEYESRKSNEEIGIEANPLRYLFNGYRLSRENNQFIAIGSLGSQEELLTLTTFFAKEAVQLLLRH